MERQVNYYNTNKAATEKQKSYLASLYRLCSIEVEQDFIDGLSRQQASTIINDLKEKDNED